MTAPVPAHPDLREVPSGPHRRVWRYLVPSSFLRNVLVLGDVPGLDAIGAAREAARVWTVAPDSDAAGRIRERAAAESVSNLEVAVHPAGRPTGSLPFEDGRFDLVVLPDYGRAGGWKGGLSTTLRECRRVMAAGGYLYMTADNRLRTRSAGLTLWAFRRGIQNVGFGPVRWFACFPSAKEPKFVMDLDSPKILDYFISFYLNLDLRTGPAIRRIGRLACRLGIAPYGVPGYAAVGRKEEK